MVHSIQTEKRRWKETVFSVNGMPTRETTDSNLTNPSLPIISMAWPIEVRKVTEKKLDHDDSSSFFIILSKELEKGENDLLLSLVRYSIRTSLGLFQSGSGMLGYLAWHTAWWAASSSLAMLMYFIGNAWMASLRDHRWTITY